MSLIFMSVFLTCIKLIRLRWWDLRVNVTSVDFEL